VYVAKWLLPVVRRPSAFLSFLFANLVWLAPLFLAPANQRRRGDGHLYGQCDDDPGGAGTAANCPANNPGGSGSCSLRDAIAAVNADTTNSAIVDMTGVSGPSPDQHGLCHLPDSHDELRHLHCCARQRPYRSGNNLYQVFLIENGSATFQNFTVATASSTRRAAAPATRLRRGIYAYTGVNLTLTNMVITGNSAANGAGGVLAAGPLTVTGTTFSNNSAPASGGGLAGALYAIGSPATIYQSTFSGNSAWIGSAIYTYTPVTLTISDSTFANNQAGTNGASAGSGGIFNDNGSTLTIHDSTFWNNTAAAGLAAP